MRRIDASGLVGASVPEVWDLFDDIPGSPRWMPFVREVATVSGPARAGTVYTERRRILGVPTTETWEITVHRRPLEQTRESELAGLDRAITITLEPRGSGTLVHVTLELRSIMPGPVGWIYEWLAGIPGGWAIRAAIHGAKRAFEGRRPA